MEGINKIDQKLLCAIFVVREFPNHVTVHHVFGGDATHRTLRSGADHDLRIDGQVLPFSLPGNRDGVGHIGDAARQTSPDCSMAESR